MGVSGVGITGKIDEQTISKDVFAKVLNGWANCLKMFLVEH